MKKRISRMLSLFLSVLMVISVMPLTAGASEIMASGTCGENLVWTLDSEGSLTISGTGAMYDWTSASSVPWYSNRTLIKKVVVESGVTSIGDQAFAYCDSLTSIDLLKGITSIGDSVFKYCDSLAIINLPEGLTSIGDSAFSECVSLTSINLPEGLTSIGGYAFSSCVSLTSIDLPESLTSIEHLAFLYCPSLTAINVAEGNNNYSSVNGVLFNKNKKTLIWYPEGKSETSYIVPSSVTKIDFFSFSYCSFRSISLSERLTTIGDFAFAECRSLTSITIPVSVDLIGGNAFDYSTLLSDVYYGGTEAQWNEVSISSGNDPLLNATIHFNSYHKHSYTSEITTPATHLTEGVMTYTCGCGDTYTETIAKLEAHTYNTVVTAPTCTEQGYTTYTCECSDTYVSDYTDAVGHSYSDGICAECGSIEDGYIAVYTKEDLNNVRNNLNGKYILMNDIVFTDADFEEGGVLYGETWGDYGNGWLPIGLEFNNNISATYFPFKGVFNGNGYSIVNLKMNRESTAVVSLDDSITTIDSFIGVYPYDSFGLFAYNEGTIKNLTLVTDFKIFIDNEIVVGGICGTNQGLVSDCRTEGTIYVENKTEHPDCFFGGIAGRLREGTITRCSNDIDFSGTNEASHPYMNCGGMVGGLSGSANVISYCYNTGDIAIFTPAVSFFGGIVARTFNTDITISNCYNAGNIGYDDFKGLASGICAEFYEEMDSTAIRNCYNAGNIIAETKTTGILYCVDNVEYDDTCYYLNVSADYGCCDWDDDNYQIDKNSLFSSQMKTEEAFDGFDFENVWIVDAKADYPYPQLRNNLQSTTELVRHIYSEQIAKEATCTENGIVRYTCDDCGFELDVDTKAIGHNYEKSGETAPTCTEKGYTTYTCSNCSSSYDSLYVAATGHDYKAVESAPTCTEEGYTTYTCACGDSYVSDYVEENGHSYTSEITTSATHLTEGVMTYTCGCGDTYTETIAKTTEHTYNAVVTAPTCTEQGFTTYTCECGDSYVADYVKENGHSHTANVTTPATHLTEGVMTYTCECGDSYTEAIDKTPEHTYNTVVTAPTCEDKGYTTYTCECGDSYVDDYVKENGHSHTAEVTTPATHLTEGVMTYTCACGDTYTEAIEKLPEHTYSTDIIAPTCTEQGFTVYTCECGDSYKDDYVNTTEHEDVDGDEYCDYCDKFLGTDQEENKCSHMCHKSGIMGFIWKIINFFQKLFGINPVCECGRAHY